MMVSFPHSYLATLNLTDRADANIDRKDMRPASKRAMLTMGFCRRIVWEREDSRLAAVDERTVTVCPGGGAFMKTVETLYTRMREDELVARLRYHEDRLREAERLAAFHRDAGETARAGLNALRQQAGARPRLTAA
jgi:hypothetical protein